MSGFDLSGFYDPSFLAHVAVALSKHREALRQSTHSCPPSLADLENFCATRCRTVQGGADLIGAAEAVHDVAMKTPPLLLNLGQAATALAVSEDTVKRLIRKQQLPAVKVGTRTLIRRTDLEQYVADLTEGHDGHQDHHAA